MRLQVRCKVAIFHRVYVEDLWFLVGKDDVEVSVTMQKIACLDSLGQLLLSLASVCMHRCCFLLAGSAARSKLHARRVKRKVSALGPLRKGKHLATSAVRIQPIRADLNQAYLAIPAFCETGSCLLIRREHRCSCHMIEGSSWIFCHSYGSSHVKDVENIGAPLPAAEGLPQRSTG